MKKLIFSAWLGLLMFCHPSKADEYSATESSFKEIKQTAPFFKNAYGYAVFPTIGKGGFGIGGAYGEGRVYEKSSHVGNTNLAQVTVGFQLGGQAFSQIIFFEDKRAFTDFTSGNFEFGAQASAVALTISANAQAGTTGAEATAGNARTASPYYKGMAVFTLAKGGLMYEASIGGQKFSYTAQN